MDPTVSTIWVFWVCVDLSGNCRFEEKEEKGGENCGNGGHGGVGEGVWG